MILGFHLPYASLHHPSPHVQKQSNLWIPQMLLPPCPLISKSLFLIGLEKIQIHIVYCSLFSCLESTCTMASLISYGGVRWAPTGDSVCIRQGRGFVTQKSFSDLK